MGGYRDRHGARSIGDAAVDYPLAEGVAMSAHSPGPWRVHDSTFDFPRTIIDADGVRVCDTHDGEYSPREDGRNWTDQPREANARLIAAAPEMLALLREEIHREPLQCSRKNHDCWECRVRALFARIDGEG